MKSIQKTLFDFDPVNHALDNFKAALHLFINRDGQIPDDE